MYLITSTFDVDRALAKTTELLSLGDAPERLADRLGMPRDLETIKDGIQAVSFRHLLDEIVRLKRYLDLDAQIEELKNGKSMLRFFGSGLSEKQMAKLEEERRKCGSLIEAPRWFYRQPRVRLLAAIRDQALDESQQDNAAWIDVDEKKLVFPIANIFEKVDYANAEILVKELEKPLKAFNARYLLENFEGNRSISFNFETREALYYIPTPIPAE